MRKWWPLVAICTGAFMLLVDVTIVTVALPDMAHGLKTSFSALQWVMDIYALILAALLLSAGAVADLVGRRRVYVLGLVVFALSSLACGIAPNSTVLVTARGVQGLGAAAMFATTMALLNSTYQGRDRGVAFGIWGAVNGAAAAAGPILGGLLTTQFGWRWVFLVNLPVSLLALGLTVRVVRESRNPHARGVDLPGMVSFTAAAGAVTYGLIRAGDDGWGSTAALVSLAAGLVALVVFVAVELRTRRPMLELRLFRNPSFSAIMIAAALLSIAAFAYTPYLSVWLQSVLELSAIQAGLVLLPMSVMAFVVAGAGGRILHDASPRLVIGGGLLLIGVGAMAQAVLSAGSGWAAVLTGLGVSGAGVGLATPTLASAGMAAVPVERSGMAAGAVNTFRQLGFALGIALLGGIFHDGLQHTVHSKGLAAALSGGQAQRTGAPRHLVHQAFAHGLNVTLLTAGGIGLAAGLLVLALVRRPAPHPAPPVAEPVPAGQ